MSERVREGLGEALAVILVGAIAATVFFVPFTLSFFAMLAWGVIAGLVVFAVGFIMMSALMMGTLPIVDDWMEKRGL